MTDMHQTNAMDGAGAATSPPGELGQAQIICVIGKTILHFSLLLGLGCLRRSSRWTWRRQRHAMRQTGRRPWRCASVSRRPSQNRGEKGIVGAEDGHHGSHGRGQASPNGDCPDGLEEQH